MTASRASAPKAAARSTERKSSKPPPAGAGATKKTSKASASRDPAPGPRGAGRGDQFGAIVAKGLDLAEASLSLGLTIINRVGSAAQSQVERMMNAMPQEAAGHDGTAHVPPPPQAPAHSAAEGVPPATELHAEEAHYAITNRIPVVPGGRVRIAFSINNDSVSSPKTVSLKAVGFTGETEGAQLDVTQLSVKPSRRRIAPMDFEKFVLEGVIPAELPSDVYHGAVVVSSGQAFSIPVRVVVQAT